MRDGYKQKNTNKIVVCIIKVFTFSIFAIGAIIAGIMGGDALYNSKLDIVKSIDVENYKITLNKSFPMIDTVYNSGNISVSFAGELQNIIKGICGFDLNSPITVLTSQSSVFYSYYNNGYKPFNIASHQPEDAEKAKAEKDIEEKSGTQVEKDPEKAEETKKYKEDASSITYEGEADENDSNEENIIKDYSKKIAINNETKYKINIEEMIKQPLKINLDRKGPKVLIFHTHTTEAYLKNSEQIGKAGISSWSTNPQSTVVRVGEALAQELRKKYGIEVIHNGTIHDYPDYNSSYSNSLSTVNKILKSYPSIKVVIDLHRDGMSSGNKKLRTVTNINGKSAAKVMLVMGTDSRKNLTHPKWKENLKFALKIQDKLIKTHPGLVKPIFLSVNRYNQHVSNQAMIIEVGGDGNTIGEALESTKYLARAISEVIQSK